MDILRDALWMSGILENAQEKPSQVQRSSQCSLCLLLPWSKVFERYIETLRCLVAFAIYIKKNQEGKHLFYYNLKLS